MAQVARGSREPQQRLREVKAPHHDRVRDGTKKHQVKEQPRRVRYPSVEASDADRGKKPQDQGKVPQG